MAHTIVPETKKKPNKPLLTQQELLRLSPCDVRRISANRARERLRERQRAADAKEARGVKPWSDSTEQLFDKAQVQTVEDMWKPFVKYNRSQADWILVRYLQDNPTHIKFHKELWALCGDTAVWGLTLKPFAKRYARRYVQIIALIIANLRRPDTLTNMIEGYFKLMKERGMGAPDVEGIKNSLLTYFSKIYFNTWAAEVVMAWTNIINGVLKIGYDYWFRIGYLKTEVQHAATRKRKPSSVSINTSATDE